MVTHATFEVAIMFVIMLTGAPIKYVFIFLVYFSDCVPLFICYKLFRHALTMFASTVMVSESSGRALQVAHFLTDDFPVEEVI